MVNDILPQLPLNLLQWSLSWVLCPEVQWSWFGYSVSIKCWCWQESTWIYATLTEEALLNIQSLAFHWLSPSRYNSIPHVLLCHFCKLWTAKLKVARFVPRGRMWSQIASIFIIPKIEFSWKIVSRHELLDISKKLSIGIRFITTCPRCLQGTSQGFRGVFLANKS